MFITYLRSYNEDPFISKTRVNSANLIFFSYSADFKYPKSTLKVVTADPLFPGVINY